MIIDIHYDTNISNGARRSQRFLTGFSLLELLIAMFILILGLVSIFSLFGIGAQAHRRGINDVILASYAETVLAEVQNKLMMGELLMDTEGQTHPNFPPDLKYDILFQELSIQPAGLNPEAGIQMVQEILVTITIKWSSARGIESKKFQTILVK